MTGTEKRDGERLVGGLVCFCKEKKKKRRSEKEFSLECIPATAFITVRKHAKQPEIIALRAVRQASM